MGRKKKEIIVEQVKMPKKRGRKSLPIKPVVEGAVKKGRGRPSNGKPKIVKPVVEGAVKKGRGRPSVSGLPPKEKVEKKGKGRPEGVINTPNFWSDGCEYTHGHTFTIEYIKKAVREKEYNREDMMNVIKSTMSFYYKDGIYQNRNVYDEFIDYAVKVKLFHYDKRKQLYSLNQNFRYV